jgi:GTP-binding protein
LTATRGTGLFNTLFHGYEPYMGDIDIQDHGALVALENGAVSTYALTKLQQRGEFIVKPGDEVYAGQVVGSHIRSEELVINVCMTKKLSAVRTAPTGMTEGLAPTRALSLDDAIQYLGSDDLLEVTPAALRIRKADLRHEIRQRAAKRLRSES